MGTAMAEHITEPSELADQELDDLAAGAIRPLTGGCNHKSYGAYKTGHGRDVYIMLAWKQHQYEYYCPRCRKTFWDSK